VTSIYVNTIQSRNLTQLA